MQTDHAQDPFQNGYMPVAQPNGTFDTKDLQSDCCTLDNQCNHTTISSTRDSAEEKVLIQFENEDPKFRP